MIVILTWLEMLANIKLELDINVIKFLVIVEYLLDSLPIIIYDFLLVHSI